MKEYHIFYAPSVATTHTLPADESAHAVRVLRMKEGDTLCATDGCGRFYECTLTLASPKGCRVCIDSEREEAPLWNGSIHLAVAPTKNMDRIEWFAEKATEIGLDSIFFLSCKNSERRVVKTDRVERIVVAAMKQSHKARKPAVSEMQTFKQFVARPFAGQRFIAHCYPMTDVLPDAPAADAPFLLDALQPSGDALVLIGPEGDFSLDEVRAALAAGYQSISLGPSRLRTETAALVAVHLMNIAKRCK